MLLYFLAAVAAVWLLSGIYQVKADEVAIVERLGEYLPGQVEHGLHYHMPWPIDRVHVISVQQQFTLTVKAFNASPAEYDDFKREYLKNADNPFGANPAAINAIFNPYLISADKSVLHMQIAMQFRVQNPERWLQSVSHDYHETYDSTAEGDMRNALLQQIAQHAMIVQAARMPFNNLLLLDQAKIPGALQNLLQPAMKLDAADAADPAKRTTIDLGIQVLQVVVTALRPPDAIKPAYENVTNQLLGRDTNKSNAQAEANSMLVKAGGEKQTLITDAQSYKQTIIQAAKGEADRFSEVLTQYRNAPDVTRWNLYVEATGAVTSNAKRIFFVQPGQRTYIEVDPAQYDPNQVKPAANP